MQNLARDIFENIHHSLPHCLEAPCCGKRLYPSPIWPHFSFQMTRTRSIQSGHDLSELHRPWDFGCGHGPRDFSSLTTVCTTVAQACCAPPSPFIAFEGPWQALGQGERACISGLTWVVEEEVDSRPVLFRCCLLHFVSKHFLVQDQWRLAIFAPYIKNG